MLAMVITKLVGWAVTIFCEVERSGPELTSGPVLVAANHPNALVDPLVIFHTAGRSTRPLAKAPLFEQALVGTVLKGLGGLPVYRRQDDPALMHLNDRTFDAAIEVLAAGGAVQIYPEGQSHSEPSMTPLRTGAARIALMTEERSGWTLGLCVQPVGLTYARKHLFRGRAVAAFGEAIPVREFRAVYERDAREGVRRLTEAIAERLEGLTLSYERVEDRELVDVAERLYAREKGLARPRERESLAERLPRLQRFSEGLRRLSAEDPVRLATLRRDVARYLRLLTVLGATEGDVPKRYRSASVARYAARQLAMLLLVAPVAAAGAALWAPPFLATRRIVVRFRPKLDQIATYKVSVGIVAFTTWLGLLAAVAWWLGGWRTGVALLILSPIAGLATIAWRERGAVALEDARVFLRVRGRERSRRRLAEHRERLVARFDAIAREWRAGGVPRERDEGLAGAGEHRGATDDVDARRTSG